MRNRMTTRTPVRTAKGQLLSEIDRMERMLKAQDEDDALLRETQELADEEAEIAEESTGIPVTEEEDQNERVMENWPIEARNAVARRLVNLAKKAMEL